MRRASDLQYVDNAVEGWGYLRVSGDGPRCHGHSGRRSVDERGELGNIGSTPTSLDAHFSTVHRPYYDYNPFSNREGPGVEEMT